MKVLCTNMLILMRVRKLVAMDDADGNDNEDKHDDATDVAKCRKRPAQGVVCVFTFCVG